MEPMSADARDAPYPPSSMPCKGWPDLLVEEEQGKALPTKPVYYEYEQDARPTGEDGKTGTRKKGEVRRNDGKDRTNHDGE